MPEHAVNPQTGQVLDFAPGRSGDQQRMSFLDPGAWMKHKRFVAVFRTAPVWVSDGYALAKFFSRIADAPSVAGTSLPFVFVSTLNGS